MTLRLRLTLLYGVCFLVAGTVLLAITYGLVSSSSGTTQVFAVGGKVGPPGPLGALPAGASVTFRSADVPTSATPSPIDVRAYRTKLLQAANGQIRRLSAAQRKQLAQVQLRANVALKQQHDSQLTALLTKSGVALLIMAFLSIGFGWVMAGRALRPLRTMNARARRITEHNLHERLALEPRGDELGELAQTFDGLLGRLERAFASQRRFVANASHELRTPVTLSRALVEVALADSSASVESLRACCERVLAAGEQQERLIEALLTLARSQGGIAARDAVDLGTIARELVALREGDASRVAIETALGPATARGDRALIERLAANLLDNAIAYNVVSGEGWVRVWTGIEDGRPTLRVENSGRDVPVDRVPELFEPFRRLDGERTAGARGLGLGLSIVSAIATAHRAALRASARPDGGLDVEVSFPAG